MATTNTTTKTTNPILNTVLVFSVGLSALEISQLVFDRNNAASVLNLEFTAVFESMFQGMFLSVDTLTSFWAVFIAWAIAGLIAGVRAKNGFWGTIAGFFGSIFGIVFLIVLNLTALETMEATVIFNFIIGATACILATCVAAYATGTATKPKPVQAKAKRTRKAWAASKEKEVWTCHRCDASIPPGAFSCPNCGEAVIE
ncbi:MAG: hypothetical protein ACXAC8_00105 [Candidatus Hodarchaeales archaeon]|jgi:ribosomal protein L40E